MNRKILAMLAVALVLLSLSSPALAMPPYPEGPKLPVPVQPPGDKDTMLPLAERAATSLGKSIDQPRIEDYLRIRERRRLLEAGKTAEAKALAQTGTDRVLVILVEYAGPDTFTWTAGVSTWDPYGIANDDEDTGTPGDCSLIITQTTVFTYTGPLHNEIPRPISADDRSGQSVWTEDFSNAWFEGFMFGNGVTFNYTRTDGSLVYADFTGKSVTNYFKDMSDDTYTLTGDVIGWVQVPHSTWWYAADDCPGARSGAGGNFWHGAIPGAGNARTLRNDALDAINAISDTIPGFNWADYDQDTDGIIDRLWIVHAGYGEEDGTDLLNRTDYGEASMWSHSSSGGTPYPVAPGIAAGPYIMMPENGGICVFAHEAGHNMGADDLYAYGPGNTSAGFWTLMSDSWTGYPIGFEPSALDPWHLDGWGWLDPYVMITDTNLVYTVTLGQASEFPGSQASDVPGQAMYRGVMIDLPDSGAPRAVPVWQGSYYWWGEEQNLANAMMTTASPIDLTAAATATLSFDLVYDTEDLWDFLWIQVSTDGVTWDYTDTLTNANTQCTHDPGWIGQYYGFPDDLCGAGIGGFWGFNANWPNPENQVFDLSAYVGQNIYIRFWYMTDWGTVYSGTFVDNVQVETDAGVIFSDDAEAGDANWVYQSPWVRTIDSVPFTHNYYLQWRNVNSNGGYDEALGTADWRFGPANTGLLVWYNNNFYTNNEIWSYLFDYPSVGPKGRMLVLDAHPEPYRDPDLVALGFDNEGGNVTSRGQMRDAPFTLVDTVDFTHTDPYRAGAREHSYAGQPAVSSFHDSMGYYPGAEYVRRGPAYPATQFKWVTKMWDASGAVPATAAYPLDAPGYPGGVGGSDNEFRFRCSPYLDGPFAGYLSCYWFGSNTGLPYAGGTGNPGDYGVQWGWHVELIEEASDHTWATVRIWNSAMEFDDEFMATPSTVARNGRVDYTYTLDQNIGSRVENALVVVTFPTTPTMAYIPNSATGGAMPLPVGMPAQQVAALYAEGGKAALDKLAVSSQDGEVGAIAWFGGLYPTGKGGDEFGFSVTGAISGTMSAAETLIMSADIYDGATYFQTTDANPVTILPYYKIHLPIVLKEY